MPSKRIAIKCRQAFIHAQIKTVDALDQLSMSKKSVGSYFVNRHSTRKGTGLTDEEVRVLLPLLLSMPSDAIDFRKEVDKYYTEINTMIPYTEKGLELEVGLEQDSLASPILFKEEDEDGKKVKKYYNLPLNLEEYIKYRHAKGHPHVAGSPAKSNSTVMFYVEDPDVTVEDAVKEGELKDDAVNLYQQIKDDPKKVKAVLSLLSNLIPKKNPNEIIVVDAWDESTRKMRLRELALSPKHWKAFYATANDPNVHNRYLLSELIKVSLLKRAGTSILVTESNEVLGINEAEALDNLFVNPASAQLLNSLKAQFKSKKTQSAIGK
jgi:hypothetical protein